MLRSKIFFSVTLHLTGQWIFHKMCWNRDQSDCGIAIPADTETSAEHGPEQTHVIGPARSRESDWNSSEPTYIILYSVMQRMGRGLL